MLRSKVCAIDSCMFDCPEHTNTSPKTTSWMVEALAPPQPPHLAVMRYLQRKHAP